MSNFFRGIIRASSFFRKEIFEILRQPRLIATLVIGPFLILFLFGIGYRSQTRTLRTLFVVQSNSPITAQDIQDYGKIADTPFIYSGSTANQSEALDKLRQGQIDLVIVVPTNATSIIKNNQQGVFTFYHHEIDPVQANYFNYVGWVYVGGVNQQVLRTFAKQGQKDSVALRTQLQESHQNVATMRKAIQSGDEALAQQKQQGLINNLDAVSQTVGASLNLVDSLQQAKGTNGNSDVSAQSTVNDLRQNTNQLNDNTSTKDEKLVRLDKIDKDITDLDGKLVEFQSIDPSIIVSPFRSETKGLVDVQPTILDFFAPAVLALLLQHLAVTFASLSIVRERNVGTMELFRVSPLSAGEALLGKYISYMLFGAVIAAILSALLVFILHVPMMGNWWNFTLVIAVELFTSLGIGFAISIISQTDSQAVQYSMIILLASVFFSGFIMSLDMLWGPVRGISWLLPTTYGTVLLRDIALRGNVPNWELLGFLLGFGLVLMLVSWLLLRRLIVSKQ
jgi:ABC-2 type transport system permease protein